MEGTPQDPVAAFGNVIEEVIRYASAGEKINAAARALKMPLELLGVIVEQDPELAPELATAATQLFEVMETLQRSHTFLSARLDARVGNIADSLGPTEGD